VSTSPSFVGWGDRTRKIVASFLLSLALNRTFILDMTWPCPIEHLLADNLIPWSASGHARLRTIPSAVNISSSSVATYAALTSLHNRYAVLYMQTRDIAYFEFIARHAQLHQSLFTRFRLKRQHIDIITLYPLFYQLLIKLKAHLQEKLDRLDLDGLAHGEHDAFVEPGASLSFI
jgi:hypothetical protein